MPVQYTIVIIITDATCDAVNIMLHHLNALKAHQSMPVPVLTKVRGRESLLKREPHTWYISWTVIQLGMCICNAMCSILCKVKNTFLSSSGPYEEVISTLCVV